MSTRTLGFSSFPNLISTRLELRQLNDSDIHPIFFLRSDSTVNQYIKRVPLRKLSDAEAFISRITKGIEEQTILYWAICLKNSPLLIGTICLWNFNDTHTEAEMGYELHPEHQNKGIMNEAMAMVLEHAEKELHLTAIEAFTHRSNAPSTSLLKKNKFILQPARKDPDVETNVIYRRVLSSQ